MFNGIDFEKLFNLFVYDQYDPLLFGTSLFLFLFFGLLIVYRLVQNQKQLRVFLLIVFSLFFYYKVSGLFFSLLILSSIINFYAGKFIKCTSNSKRKLIFITTVLLNLALLGYFKYTNFFIQIISDLNLAHWDALEILLPIGISFYTFKALSYVIEIYLENIEPEENFFHFLLYISFFPNIMAGPIDRPGEFLPQINKSPVLNNKQIGFALLLIVSGLFKKAVIADYLSLNFVDRVFDFPVRFTGVENLLAVYGYGLQIYCDFSGYTDMALGIALLLGYNLMENFRWPYKATSISDFWRRWHISLSSWLLDYVFKPLQIKLRNLKIWGNALAILITFVAIGFWHGASWLYILFGFIHGFYIAFSLFVQKPKRALYDKLGLTGSKLLRVFQVIVTFHLVSFAWIFFRARSFENAFGMLRQIFTYFHSEVFMQFIVAYKPVVAMMVIGYLLHFLPNAFEKKSAEFLSKIPVVLQAAILAIMIWIVVQVRSADIQPFIYFQY